MILVIKPDSDDFADPRDGRAEAATGLDLREAVGTNGAELLQGVV